MKKPFYLFNFQILMPENKKLPLIIAHRGDSAAAPENTLAAFRQAIEAGADGIEFDVRLAKGGVPVVFHDSNLQRMAKKKRRVSDFTSAELQSVDVGAWFNSVNSKKADAKFSGESIPTLAALLEFLRGYKKRIYVELKGKSEEMPALVEAVAKLLKQSDLLPNVILKSFKLQAVAQARKMLPEVCTAALFAPKIVSLLHKKSRLIECAREVGANELSLHYSLATKKTVAAAAAQNMPVTIWTADHPAWIKRSLERGIYAVITNNPGRLIARRDEILRKD